MSEELHTKPTSCAICGAETDCLHYNCPSCGCCKAFFRRCITHNLSYKCKLKGECDMKKFKCCKGCRLRRCFDAGMDPRMVQKKEIVPKRPQKLKLRRHSKTAALQNSFVFDQYNDAKLVETFMELEVVWQNQRESCMYYPVHLFTMSLDDLVKVPCQLSSTVSSLEQRLIKNNIQPIVKKKYWFFVNFFSCVGHIKAMPFFHRLGFMDQKILLANVALTMTTLVESYYSFSHKDETLIHPDGWRPIIKIRKKSAKKLVSKSNPPSEPFDDHFCRLLQPLYRVGPTSEDYLILKAIIICNPMIPGLSDHAKDLLESINHKFTSALLRRNQARLGTIEGAKRYSELISLIETYFYLTKKKKELHVWASTYRKKFEPMWLTSVIHN